MRMQSDRWGGHPRWAVISLDGGAINSSQSGWKQGHRTAPHHDAFAAFSCQRAL